MISTTPTWMRTGAASADDVVPVVGRSAVTSGGRRDPQEAIASAITTLPAGAAIILAHAGSASARWSLDRPCSIGGDVIDPVTRRRARQLDVAAVDILVGAWADAARHIRLLGGIPIVAAIDDDLLHGAISPVGGGGQASDLVLSILRACAPCDLLLTVEDLAPGGLTPTRGVAFARRAVEAASASRLFAAGGTGWLEPLRRRRKGRSADRSGLGLASAAWCIGQVPAEVHGVVRGDVDRDIVLEKARRAGLHGVLQLDDEAPADQGNDAVADDAAQPGNP